MKILDIKDLEDGDCLITFEVEPEEQRRLIEYAVLDLLKKAVEEKKPLKSNLENNESS